MEEKLEEEVKPEVSRCIRSFQTGHIMHAMYFLLSPPLGNCFCYKQNFPVLSVRRPCPVFLPVGSSKSDSNNFFSILDEYGDSCDYICSLSIGKIYMTLMTDLCIEIDMFNQNIRYLLIDRRKYKSSGIVK